MQTTATINIKVIVGSTRKNRFSEKPAAWILEETKKREGVEAELLDLRDYPLPFYEEAVPPTRFNGKYPSEMVEKWSKKVAEGDAYIIVTPEYNHGYPAVLKNAFDYVYAEWNNKPIGFVSYGGVAGARSVEQLRLVAIELQMAPIRNAVHIPVQVYMAVMNEKSPVNPQLFEPVKKHAEGFLDQLLWWARALKAARETKV